MIENDARPPPEVPPPEPEYCTIRQACQRAGVSRRTIYNWLQHGLLTFHRTAGGAVRIQTSSLFRPGTA